MGSKPSERRVIMARKVAENWLTTRARAEYRVRVYHNSDCSSYVNLLRGFRDAKVKIANVDPIPDLGIRMETSGFTVWSSDQNSLKTLKMFLESKGMETSWIW
jgi:hypothetical protein